MWDESQTDGAPLPELDKVTGEAGVYLDRLREYVNAQGITLEYNESIAPALGLAFGNTIRLLPGQTDAGNLHHAGSRAKPSHAQTYGAAHSDNQDRARDRSRGDSFCCRQGNRTDTSTASADYISLYHGNAALLTESLEAVQQTSAVILAAITVEESISQEVSQPAAEAALEHKRARRSRIQAVTTEAA